MRCALDSSLKLGPEHPAYCIPFTIGGKIQAGTVADVMKAINSTGYYYNTQGRFYIVTYPHTDDPSNMYVKAGVAKQGLMTLFQK